MVENLAIVDLGSNSARMAITEIAPDGRFREIRRVKENTRLSEGMGREKCYKRVQLNAQLRL